MLKRPANGAVESLVVIGTFMKGCVKDMETKDRMQGEMLRTLFKRLIINITRIAKKQTESYERFSDEKVDVVRMFNLLLEGNFRKEHEVQLAVVICFKLDILNNKKLIMKTKQTNMNSKKLLKNLSVTAAFIGFCMVNISASARTFTGLEVPADTTKMIAGVPVKPEDISPLLSGENIPQVKLINDAGESFDLNAAVASKPTILIFYRGGWCPFCSKQLAGLQEIEGDLTKMGYQLLAVSTDSPENLKQSKTKSKLTYTLLSDADLAVSKQFGIAFKSPKNYDKFLPETSGGKNADKLLPVPSVFILNRKGNIRFEYINPDITQRLSPDLLKAAASSLIAEL